ncbi:hypothetical protein [Actinomadura kijaniata]|uniref:hypothetical protein n=1 Tax=Actinomadura kijaniata TaxID=46161 RepID=UPI00082DABA9|nr:hypothetical protein [Actinomadura kijaniata]
MQLTCLFEGGLRQALATAAELDGPCQGLGALMVVDGCSDRALCDPDPPPAPANMGRYRKPARA